MYDIMLTGNEHQALQANLYVRVLLGNVMENLDLKRVDISYQYVVDTMFLKVSFPTELAIEHINIIRESFKSSGMGDYSEIISYNEKNYVNNVKTTIILLQTKGIKSSTPPIGFNK